MTYDNNPEFIALVQRLQSVAPFHIEQIDASGTPQPWITVSATTIVPELLINPHTLRMQVDALAAQVATWGRLVAQCKRVWEVHERRYRHWRSGVELKCLKEGVPGIDKTTQASIEAYYRQLPEYGAFQTQIERAEEAYNAASAILDAFKEKGQQLRRDVRIGSDGSITRFTP